MSELDPEQVIEHAVEQCTRLGERLEFETFWVGIRLKRATKRALGDDLDAWKTTVKRGVGRQLEALWTDRVARPGRPDVDLVYDVDRGKVTPDIRSVYLYGRYRKLDRALTQTQTPWTCPACDGKKCEACEQTGTRFPHSVESRMALPCAGAFKARVREISLHGMGREDVDVRCLGQGRPFVLEVARPARREVDLAALTATIEAENQDRLELPSGLRVVPVEVVARIKEWAAPKRYRATCDASRPPSAAALDALVTSLNGCTLEQRTPVRVAHRRSDLVRRRTVHTAQLVEADGPRFVLDIEAESGTYIKELISGDDGRTLPSASSLLEIPSTCTQLDVQEILVDDAEILELPPA